MAGEARGIFVERQHGTRPMSRTVRGSWRLAGARVSRPKVPFHGPPCQNGTQLSVSHQDTYVFRLATVSHPFRAHRALTGTYRLGLIFIDCFSSLWIFGCCAGSGAPAFYPNNLPRSPRCQLREAACAGPDTPGSPVDCSSLLIQSAGISNRHLIPLEAMTSSTLPSSSNGISSRIMLVP
jgi:hypothetical protein